MAKKKNIPEFLLSDILHTLRIKYLGVNANDKTPTISKFIIVRFYTEDNKPTNHTDPYVHKIYTSFNGEIFYELPMQSKADWLKFESFMEVLGQSADVGIKLLSVEISKKLGLTL